MANVEFGTGKTVVILSIVAACFAVLWPKIFYPMLTAMSSKKMDSDSLNGCCDVMFETDINAYKIMNEMCGTILSRQEEFNPKLSQAFQQGKLTKDIVNMCRTEVMNMCGIDIAEFLNKKERLGRSYKQMLDEIRSFNISICLRQNFGVNPGLLGAPRRMRIWGFESPRHLRQERPLHFRPEMMHPALREKGRAIPQSHVVPKTTNEKDQSTRTIPMSGMRPPMGGAGHVVPPPKVGGTMSVVMPLYTIGIVIFFMYTVMKVFMKKTSGNDESFKDFHSDPEFRRVVFADEYTNGSAQRPGKPGPQAQTEKKPETPQVWKSPTDDSTRLGWKERYTIMTAITGLLTEVDQQLNRAGDTQTQYSTERKDKKNLDETCTDDVKVTKKTEPDSSEQVDILNVHSPLGRHSHTADTDESSPKIKVVGLEMMAECEGGQKWSRPATPNLGVGGQGRPTTPGLLADGPEPLNIFLEGSLPQQSQLLVSDSKTQAFTIQDESEPEPPVILSSKMTLSLISLDAPVDDAHNRHPEPSNFDLKTDDDNLGSADSTLLDADSEILIDESGQTEFGSLQVHEQPDEESEKTSHLVNEVKDDQSTTYATATGTGRAEPVLGPDVEDTAADMSNLDGLEVTNQEDLQTENVQLWNGSTRESEVHEQVSTEEEETEEDG